MANHFLRSSCLFFASLALAAFFSGCDSTSDTSQTQAIHTVVWLPDESGMLAVVEKTTISVLDNTETITRGVYHVGLDGSLGGAIGPGDQNVISPYNFVVLAISPDGSNAIVQGGANVYRMDVHSNNYTEIADNTTLLGVSPDVKYILTTSDSYTIPAPLYTVFDISGSTTRRVSVFTPVGVIGQAGRAIWTDGGTFALTHLDTNGYTHVSMWDTTGTLLRSYGDAEASFNSSQYASRVNQLFTVTRSGNIEWINTTTGVRDTVLPPHYVESLDASQDGRLVAYTSGDSTSAYSLIAVNPATGATSTIAGDAITPIISPTGTRVAYIHRVDPDQDIKVTSISVP